MSPSVEGRVYSAFEVSFRLPFEPQTRLMVSSSPPQLVLNERPPGPVPEPTKLVYRSPQRLADGEPFFSFLESPDGERLAVGNSLHFVSPRGPTVVVERQERVTDDLVEAYFIGTLMPLWLELNGWLALHCAAVKVDGGVVGLIGRSGAGKSTLAAAMMNRGHSLITEDVLPLRAVPGAGIVARGGYPELRISTEAGTEIFGNRFAALEKEPFGFKRRIPVGERNWGEFSPGEHQLRGLVLLDRVDNGASVESKLTRLANRRALVELLRFSFHARLVETLGLRPARLGLLSDLVRAIPVHRLSYPSGFEELDEVCSGVETAR